MKEQDFYCRLKKCKFHHGISKNQNVICSGNLVLEKIEDNEMTCYSFEQTDQ